MLKKYWPLMLLLASPIQAQTTLPSSLTTTTQPGAATPGEKFPSDDAVVWDFHNLGDVHGVSTIYRSASPLRDLEKKSDTPPADLPRLARTRLQRLFDHGIRTIISFEQASPATAAGKEDKVRWMQLEQQAAKEVGIAYVSIPMSSTGPGSLQTISDQQTLKWLEQVDAAIFTAAKSGGVDIHCSAGHDRTGIVTAYLRIKYGQWSVERAIQEMRDFGHNWPKYSANGGQSSWHEDHLRAIAPLLVHSGATNDHSSSTGM